MKAFGSLRMTTLVWKHTNSGEILCPAIGMQHPWLAEKHITLGLAISINKRLQQPAFYSYNFD